ncbi:hypothetical protein J4406_01185 [Candidatus Woesearchaeota archaeon]|nr:hypothetical protein [Candidatus Woesearchaeota archaeon]
MKKIELLKELGKYPLFNLKTVRDMTNKDGNYTKLLIHRLKKDKLIFEIEKNKYTLNKDSFTIASNMIWPCYISGWSAVSYYHLTDQIPQAIFVITTRARKKREIIFNNTKIIFTRVKPKYFFGYKRERYGDYDIFIAEKEKALIDSALLKKISFSEICDIIKDNVEDINIPLLIKYLIKIKNKSLMKRFGFLLDRLNIKNDELSRLIDFKYIPLDELISKKGKKDKKWRIIDNVGL